MRARFMVCSLALPLLSSCATLYYARPGDVNPAWGTVAPDQRIAVFQRAIPVLLDQGYVPDVLNEVAGFIKAKRREDIANDVLAHTLVLVSISAEGRVRIAISGSGYFASEKEFARVIDERQALLARLILGPPEAAPGDSRRP